MYICCLVCVYAQSKCTCTCVHARSKCTSTPCIHGPSTSTRAHVPHLEHRRPGAGLPRRWLLDSGRLVRKSAEVRSHGRIGGIIHLVVLFLFYRSIMQLWLVCLVWLVQAAVQHHEQQLRKRGVRASVSHAARCPSCAVLDGLCEHKQCVCVGTRDTARSRRLTRRTGRGRTACGCKCCL
jgi:hypothetical protein